METYILDSRLYVMDMRKLSLNRQQDKVSLTSLNDCSLSQDGQTYSTTQKFCPFVYLFLQIKTHREKTIQTLEIKCRACTVILATQSLEKTLKHIFPNLKMFCVKFHKNQQLNENILRDVQFVLNIIVCSKILHLLVLVIQQNNLLLFLVRNHVG